MSETAISTANPDRALAGQGDQTQDLPAILDMGSDIVATSEPDAITDTPPPRPAGTAVTLSLPQKAVIIISALGEDGAALLEQMDESHLTVFAACYKDLKRIPRSVLHEVITEFIEELNGSIGAFFKGTTGAEDILSQLLDDDQLSRIMLSIQGQEDEDSRPVWDRLEAIAPEELAGWLTTQRIQLSVIVISRLSSETAGRVLAQLPEEQSRRIVLRLTKPVNIDTETEDIIANIIRSTFFDATGGPGQKTKAVSFVSTVMNYLPFERRETIMSYVEEKTPQTATAIKNNLLTFEDLPDRLPRNAVPIVFRDMDQQTLLTSLKYGEKIAPGTLDYLFSNISQRMARALRDQLEDMTAPAEKEAQDAQIRMMLEIGRLDREGMIKLLDPGPASLETF